jgi:tetratricopeptide (TPR) repeat protein
LQAKHYISVGVGVVLIVALYWGGNTIPPLKKPVADMQRPNSGGAVAVGHASAPPFSFDSLATSLRAKLPGKIADSVKTFDSELRAIHDSSKMSGVFLQLSEVWGRAQQPKMAAYYSARSAKLEKSEKKLTFAGQFFLQLMENEHSASDQAWEAAEAVSCLEQSLKINPDNEDTKLALATGYIEGTGEPMRGVQILLAVTREKPNDVPANMLLGRMSIQSGQFDKAIGRFETVLKTEPENKEALYFLAQAWEGKGDKKKAIELLEKCKKIVNDPAFSKEIDQKISSLK